MTEKNEPETDKLDKSLGQIGYEAMLGKMVRDDGEPERLHAAYNLWENQCEKLQADWEAVAAAIGDAAVQRNWRRRL